jgi:Ca-activated chloride channel homolog
LREFNGRLMKKIFLCALFVFCIQALPVSGQEGVPKSEPAGQQLSYGIVVDNSGSYRLILNKVIDLVKDVVEENKAGDEAFMVSFVGSDRIRLVQEFTGEKADLEDAAESLYIQGGPTAIVDALYFSAKYLAKSSNNAPGRQKVLILISDGDERQSATKYEDLAKFLKDEKILVFAIGIAEDKVFTKLLDRVTKESGGKLYLPKTTADITGSVKTLTADVRKK